MAEVVAFADWELGPLKAFDSRWVDPKFAHQSITFLGKFVDGQENRIENPSLICRRQGKVDGALPRPEEVEALSSAIAFAFLDENPRKGPKSQNNSWSVVTSDNTEVFFWPVDLEAGLVTVTSGIMVRTISGGFRLDDPELVVRPPLDLFYFGASPRPSLDCLEAVYAVVLESLLHPGAKLASDQVRTAIGWLVKAWRNTATVHFPERLVFLKTGFEAITGTSNSWRSARQLRSLFESLPNTSDRHSERGRTPDLNYVGPTAAYNGHLVFTAEYILRAAIKASLEGLGFRDLWRPPLEGAIRRGLAKLTAAEESSQQT